ncbi:serine hydrolase domain-containing protein [Enterococcus mundtii]|uniref:serine hydrolase domain-containing protein n=1 Tax=Enterococcus mundtii TaxID=53346 RepID=UPI00115AF592|nr:serine hydrolase domain-containing protein [Enterococcus mundtii]
MYAKTKEYILKKMNEGYYPGVVAAFMKGDQIEKVIAGDAQIIPIIRPMTEDLLFDVASLTKVIATTSLVLRLIEDGKVELDEPLHTYLPTFENQTITIRHLLTHTSDIQTFIPNRDRLSQTELIEAYLKLQPGDQLGIEVRYTDAGTILLGLMLEEIFQEEAVELFEEQVLAPLGMMNSLFLPRPSERIVPTEQLPSGEVIHGLTHDPKARVLAEHAGNAGLFIDLADCEKFVRMYLQYGKLDSGHFLEEATIRSLLADHTPTGKGGRSLGWDLKQDKKDGHPLLFHTGYTGTFLLIDPIDQEAFIFLSNRLHPNDHREEYLKCRDEIIEIYLQEKALH